jgi:5-methylcytosine-specific restriction endonuclease McrA
MWHSQRSRARQAHQWLEYLQEDLLGIVEQAVRGGRCPYCARGLTPENFGADHRRPLCRGGRWTLSNLVICCKECNVVKGALDESEFRELMQLVATWVPEVKVNLFARIKGGSRLAKFSRPKEKSGVG